MSQDKNNQGRLRRSVRRKLYDAREGMKRIRDHGTYMNRIYYVLDEKKLVYVTNRKVASSSIIASILGLAEQTNYHAVHGAAVKSDQERLDIQPADLPDYYFFTFVRNPFERLLSCYNNKYHTDKALLGWNGRVNKDLHFENYLLGYIAKDRGFKDFVKRVVRIPDWLSDAHFVSQSYQFSLHGKPIVDFVGKFEELPTSFEPIREKYALEPLPHYNKTAKRNWMDQYDLETAQWVIKRYKGDIETYGYQDTADALIDYLKKKEAGQ